jgi:phospholipase/carboxylesterase
VDVFIGDLAEKNIVEATGLVHRVYLPEHPGVAPVLVMIHGRTGNSSVMWPFARAFKDKEPVILAPEAPTPDPIGGFSWWPVQSPNPTESARINATTEDFERPLNQLSQFLRAAAEIYGFQFQRLNFVGFSQGAAMSAAFSIANPQISSSCAMLAGFLPKLLVQSLEERRPDLSQLRFFIAHGTKDETVPIQRARDGAELLRSLGADVTYIEEEVGHKIGSQALRELKTFSGRCLSEGALAG